MFTPTCWPPGQHVCLSRSLSLIQRGPLCIPSVSPKVQYERPRGWHMTATQCCATLCASPRAGRLTQTTAEGRSGRVGNLDDPQLKRRCLDDLPFPLLHKTMLGTQYEITDWPSHSWVRSFGEETLLFVGQNEANVSLAAEPTAPRRRAANRASQGKLLTGHAAATPYIDHPPRFILGILRARDIGQAGVAGMTGPGHKGARRWEFLFV